MPRLLVLTLILAAAAITAFLAACGGSGSNVYEIQADQLRFKPAVLTIPVGEEVQLRFKNLERQDHDWEARGLKFTLPAGQKNHHTDPEAGVLGVHAAPKSTVSLKFTALEKGTFDVYCTLVGHKELGMIGQLIVE